MADSKEDASATSVPPFDEPAPELKASLSNVKCAGCGKSHAELPAAGGRMHRCPKCLSALFCSSECADKNSAAHALVCLGPSPRSSGSSVDPLQADLLKLQVECSLFSQMR